MSEPPRTYGQLIADLNQAADLLERINDDYQGSTYEWTDRSLRDEAKYLAKRTRPDEKIEEPEDSDG